MRERLETEDDMNSTVIRQTLAVIGFVAILCIALLVGVLFIYTSIAGAHAAHTDIMLIVPPYQVV